MAVQRSSRLAPISSSASARTDSSSPHFNVHAGFGIVATQRQRCKSSDKHKSIHGCPQSLMCIERRSTTQAADHLAASLALCPPKFRLAGDSLSR
ncbi:hypothetical protein CBOM_07548 [Ceraceosorus bombacis]|uniref:Uncharacterized protein n=1 Tax=Ceraceosorus bombacis TaxID=401625 RepID=A0A0P1BG57_9BASI|nr:hypothetical protein CBOM_07548 [Ceraceosorus bombacis]